MRARCTYEQAEARWLTIWQLRAQRLTQKEIGAKLGISLSLVGKYCQKGNKHHRDVVEQERRAA